MNWLPPASTDMPSPAMTVLKGALQKAGFNCKILYWNILFEDIIRFYLRESSMDKISEVDYLGVFYAYIAIEKNDKDALLKQEIILKSLNPHYFSSSFDFKKHIRDAVSLLKNRIKEVLSSELQETPFMMGFSIRDNIEVNTLSFERNGIHWKILMFCNEKVRSITEILEHFKATSETDIKDTITALYSQGLLYYSIFREECVSIINTNKII